MAAGGSLTNNEPPMIADICAQAAGILQPSVVYMDLFGKETNCGETAAWFASPCNDYTLGGKVDADAILGLGNAANVGQTQLASLWVQRTALS